MKNEDTEHLEDRELNQARSKPKSVNQTVRTARKIVHHYITLQLRRSSRVCFRTHFIPALYRRSF